MKLSTNSSLYIHLTLTVRNSVSSSDLKASKFWVKDFFGFAKDSHSLQRRFHSNAVEQNLVTNIEWTQQQQHII